jgi:Leucine-rich repeat (LRR) protein
MVAKLEELLMNNKLKVAGDLSTPTVDIVAKLQEKYLTETQTSESKCKNQIVPLTCKLATLPSLDFSRCPQLNELPTSIDKLTAFRLLDFSGCQELNELPTSIDKLTALRLLDLPRCQELKELPTSIDKLIALESLDLSGCS